MASTAKVNVYTAEDLVVVDDAGIFAGETVEDVLYEIAMRTGGGKYNCSAGLAVGKWVYKTGVADEVAEADAGTVAPVIGIVTSKPSSTTCIVQSGGKISGFVGLTPGDRYFAAKGSPGNMTDDPSTIISSSGMVQKLAVAVSSTTVQIDIKQLIEIQS